MTIEIDPATGAPIVKDAQSNNPTSDFTPPTTDVAKDLGLPATTNVPKPAISEIKPPDGSTPAKAASNVIGGMPPMTKPAIESAQAKSDKQLLAEELSDILKEHGNQESNIPIHHPYWDKANLLRSMK